MSYADALGASENGSTVTYEGRSGRDSRRNSNEGICCARDFKRRALGGTLWQI
jgi:hypothetical protein